MRRGQTGKVYRVPERNAHGDPVDVDGNVVRGDANGSFLGEIKGVIFGGISMARDWTPMRKILADTNSQIGVPMRSKIRLKFGDRIVFGDTQYRVVSRRLWEYANSLSGTRPDYYWVEVEGIVD